MSSAQVQQAMNPGGPGPPPALRLPPATDPAPRRPGPGPQPPPQPQPDSVSISSGEEGATPLMYACQQGRDQDVRAMLKARPSLALDRDRTGKTALHYCAELAGPAAAAPLLQVAPQLLDAKDQDGYCTLTLAVIAGNRSLVRYLLARGADVNALDNEKHSVVHWATVCGEAASLELVLGAGARASTPDLHGGYPLHYAAQLCGPLGPVMGPTEGLAVGALLDRGAGLAVLRALLASGAPVGVHDQDGRQPILWAASAGSADAILALVNAGASVEADDKDGLTALHCAASRGHTDCVETLVGLCGADVDVIDSNGCTALFYAVTLGHADCTRVLLAHGAEPNRQDRKGRTAAHCGAAKGQLETLRILAAHGANLWLRNVRGDFPLHDAVQSGRKDLVLWLLQQRPDAVNTPNNDGRCPLHIAALHNNVEMCKVLLDNRALLNPVMRSSRQQLLTPLDAALHRGNRGCAKYLQLHGGVPANRLTEKSAQTRGGGHRSSVSEPAPERTSPDITVLGSRTRSVGNSPAGFLPPANGATERTTFQVRVDDDVAIRHVEHIDTGLLLCRHVHESSDEDRPGTRRKKSRRHERASSEIMRWREREREDRIRNRSSSRSHSRSRSSRDATLRGGSDSEGSDGESRISGRVDGEKSARRRKRFVDMGDEDVEQEDHDGEPGRTSRRRSRKGRSKKDEEATLQDQPREEVRKSGSAPKKRVTYQIVGRTSTSELEVSDHDSDEGSRSRRNKSSRVSSPERTPGRSSRRSADNTGSSNSTDDSTGGRKDRYSSGDEGIRDTSARRSRTEERVQEEAASESSRVGEDGVAKERQPVRDRSKAERTIRDKSKPEQMVKDRGKKSEVSKESTKTDNKDRSRKEEATREKGKTEEAGREGSKTEDSSKHKNKRGAEEEEEKQQSVKKESSRTDSGKKRETEMDSDRKEEEEGKEKARREDSGKVREDGGRDSAKLVSSSTVTTTTTTTVTVRTEGPTDSPDEGGGEPNTTVVTAIVHQEEEHHDGKAEKEIVPERAAEQGVDPLPPRDVVEEEAAATSDSGKASSEDKSNKSDAEDASTDASPQDTPRGEGEVSVEGGIPQDGVGVDDQGGHGDDATSPERTSQPTPPTAAEELDPVSKSGKTKPSGAGRTAKDGKGRNQDGRARGNRSTSKEGQVESRDGSRDDRSSRDRAKAHGRTTGPTPSRGRRKETRRPRERAPKGPDHDMDDGTADTMGVVDGDVKTVIGSENALRLHSSVQDEEGDNEDADGSEPSSDRSHNEPDSQLVDSGLEPSPRREKPSDKEAASADSSPTRGGGKVPRICRKKRDRPGSAGDTEDGTVSVTRAVQLSMRKYHLERRIFHELLELKRLQIRAGRANEQVLVKRLVDDYRRAGLCVGLQSYTGTYTFRGFEKYLYDQLRALQSSNRRIIPRLQSSDDLEKLTAALRRTRQRDLLNEAPDNPLHCTASTHRCHHAVHAYSGVPCAAYIPRLNHHYMPKDGLYTGFLPHIEGATGRASRAGGSSTAPELARSLRFVDPSRPVTLELSHGQEKQVISLPTERLDKNKRYYVTFTIKGGADSAKHKAAAAPSPSPSPGPEEERQGQGPGHAKSF